MAAAVARVGAAIGQPVGSGASSESGASPPPVTSDIDWLASVVGDAITRICRSNVPFLTWPAIQVVPDDVAPIPTGSWRIPVDEVIVTDEFLQLNESGPGTGPNGPGPVESAARVKLRGAQSAGDGVAAGGSSKRPTPTQLPPSPSAHAAPVNHAAVSSAKGGRSGRSNLAVVSEGPVSAVAPTGGAESAERKRGSARELVVRESPVAGPGPVPGDPGPPATGPVSVRPIPEGQDGTAAEVQRRAEIQKNGDAFFEAALLRLGLSKDPNEQMKRLQNLCRANDAAAVLEEEKSRVKQQLKEYDALFEARHKRLPGREEKEPLRALYMYYRKSKMLIAKAQRANARPELRRSETSSAVQRADSLVAGLERHASQSLEIASWTADERRLGKLQEEKTAIRAKLQKFQEEFVKRNGRPIKYHRDVEGIESEYRQYKQLKEHIKKLEELIRRKRSLRLNQSGSGSANLYASDAPADVAEN